MDCFVIMPFDSAFDDVYSQIKSAITDAEVGETMRCTRLDEDRPAGRITDRLLGALRDSSFCVSDLTGCKANVMWETGYAMALGKPIIVLTQDIATLPFDMKDMQAITYDRAQLSRTLGSPLRSVVKDTLRLATHRPAHATHEERARSIVSLNVQLAELKEMVGQIVSTWPKTPGPARSAPGSARVLEKLEGAWFNTESESMIYVERIDGKLVAPYSYGGANELTAFYYGWELMGDYLFARFKWVKKPIKGFTFLKFNKARTITGAWWYDHDVDRIPDTPPLGAGNPVIWKKRANKPPKWARSFFEQVRQGQVAEFN